MIRAVHLQNFRGAGQGSVQGLAALTLLVGPPGSGKSSLLEALFIGASPVPQEAAARAVQRHGAVLGTRWLLFRGGEQGAAQIRVTTDTPESRNCVLHPPPAEAPPAGEGQPPPPRKQQPASGPLQGIPEVRLLEATPRPSDKPIFQLVEAARELGRLEEILESLASAFPRLLGVTTRVEATGPLAYLQMEDFELPVRLGGDALQRLLRLGLELATMGAGLVLLEEPEAHLHPQALRPCARLLLGAVRRGLQIVLCTQSLELLDALLDECQPTDLERMILFRLSLEEARLRAEGLPGPDVALLRKSLEEELR